MEMIQEPASVISIVETLEVDVAQKEILLRLMLALEKQFKTYDYRLESAGKDKVSLITLLTRTSEYPDEERKKMNAANPHEGFKGAHHSHD